MTSNTLAEVSAVLPVYNAVHLRRCVDALRKLELREIIIVDSSPVRCSELPADPRIKYFHYNHRLLPGAARNEGVKLASGKWLLFVDADVELTEEGLNYVRQADFSTPTKVVFGVYEASASKQNFFTFFQSLILRFRMLEGIKTVPFPYAQSSHFLIHREHYLNWGGFDPKLSIREDQRFCRVAHHFGAIISTDAKFSAVHWRHFSFLGLLKDYFFRPYQSKRTSLQHPALHIGELLPFRYVMTWILGACLVLSLPLGIPALIFAALVLPLPLLLCAEIFSQLNLTQKIAALALWPLIGFCACSGAAMGYIAHFISQVRARSRIILDALILGKRAVFRKGWPLGIVHFLTSRCNLRCAHCFYKETLDQPGDGEMPPEKLASLSKETGPLLWYSVGGGEPFLRADLSQALNALIDGSRPWLITIPTNGFYRTRTITTLLRVMEANPRQKILVLFSLDGPEALHNEIRGPLSWGKAYDTYTDVKKLSQIFPQLSVGLITVVSTYNADIYPGFIDTLLERFGPQQIAINLYRAPMDRTQKPDQRVLSAYHSAVNRYTEHLDNGKLPLPRIFGRRINRARELVQKSAIARIAGEDAFVTPCVAGTLFYVIWEDGRLAPCELLQDSLGNLNDQSMNTLVRTSAARKLRTTIFDTKCRCTYECAMSMNSLFSPPLAKQTVKQLFSDLYNRGKSYRRDKN